MASKDKKATAKSDDSLGFSSTNYIFFAIGIAIVIIGFIALKMGSLTLAPIFLVLGYCVIIPIAIMYRGPKTNPKKTAESNS